MSHTTPIASPETTDLERRMLAHERVLQALIAFMARMESRFAEPLRMAGPMIRLVMQADLVGDSELSNLYSAQPQGRWECVQETHKAAGPRKGKETGECRTSRWKRAPGPRKMTLVFAKRHPVRPRVAVGETLGALP